MDLHKPQQLLPSEMALPYCPACSRHMSFEITACGLAITPKSARYEKLFYGWKKKPNYSLFSQFASKAGEKKFKPRQTNIEVK